MHVQSDTLLLVDAFESFKNKCFEIYELDPAHFLSASGLAWQACFKKTEKKLELLIDLDKLLMVEKEIRGEICHAVYRYAKTNNEYMKYTICIYGQFVYMSKFNGEFIKSYDEDGDKGYILEVVVGYPKNLSDLKSGLSFLPERMKINKCGKLVSNLYY